MTGRPLAAILLLTLVACAGTRRGNAPPASLLWVGAHPDDELFAAPLLREACGPRYRCRFLVLTGGERGKCLTGHCSELASIRTRELLASAAQFDATVETWQLADHSAIDPLDVLRSWSSRSGGCAALVGRMESALGEARLVVTFASVHGTSGHADHRAVAMLVSTAAAAMPAPPAIYTIRNEAEVTRDGSDIRLLPSPTAPASALVSSFRAWGAVLDVASRHRSQFDRAAIALLRRTSPSARIIVAAPEPPAAGDWCRRP